MSFSENTAAKRIAGLAWAQAGRAVEAASAAPALSAVRRLVRRSIGVSSWLDKIMLPPRSQNLYTIPTAPTRIRCPLTSAAVVKVLVRPAEPDGRNPAPGSLESEFPRP